MVKEEEEGFRERMEGKMEEAKERLLRMVKDKEEYKEERRGYK